MSEKDGRSKQSIVLGSGYVYVVEFTGELPEDVRTFETPENMLGYIQGGYTLEYAAEFYTAKDDMAVAQKTIMTDETVKSKSGIMTWNGNTLTKLCSTARVTEKNGIRTVKIGGVGNQDGKNYAIHFHHPDPQDGDIRATIVGKNTAGFSLAFAKDKETVIDAEFNAMPCDDEGTLVILNEYSPDGESVPHKLTVAAAAGGSITTGANGEYARGDVVTLEAKPDGTNTFAGWTSTGGGTFDDPAAATVNFTMPGNDVMVLASFTAP